MLKLKDLHYQAVTSDAPVLNGLDLQASTGQPILIAGASGSGKTTLFNILLGIVKVDTGKIIISPDGKKMFPLESLPIHERCKKYKSDFSNFYPL